MFTGANRLVGVDISTRLRMTFSCVTCSTLSKPNGEDNSYLRHANMNCLHRSVLTSHIHTGKSVRTGGNHIVNITGASRKYELSSPFSFGNVTQATCGTSYTISWKCPHREVGSHRWVDVMSATLLLYFQNDGALCTS